MALTKVVGQRSTMQWLVDKNWLKDISVHNKMAKTDVDVDIQIISSKSGFVSPATAIRLE